MNMMKATIANIKRFAVHDGDGIRTTVFFKGCPLKCVWCHNPETIEAKKQIAFYSNKCVNCGICTKICKCHKINDNLHTFDRSECNFCEECAKACPKEAIEIIGREMTVDEIYDICLKDEAFYIQSGGGVTLSGGECLLQADFCAELLKRLKSENINTAVDTCGFVSKEKLDTVIPYTDVFLYDIKAFDEHVHIKCTGKSNKIIWENLRYLDASGKSIEIRIPYVPEYNSFETERIFEKLQEFKNIIKVRILPYHSFSGFKYESLGIENTLPSKLPEKNVLELYQKKFDEVWHR